MAVALVAAGATGCGDDEDSIPVTRVRTLGDSRLEFTLACYKQVRVEIQERADRVVVHGFGEDPIGGDCGALATTTLSEPLGDREVIDAETGRVLSVDSSVE